MLNPFAKYRKENKCSWQDMANLCDLHVSQVGYILKMKPTDMERLVVGTIIKIKLAIGVDLYEWTEDSFIKKVLDEDAVVSGKKLKTTALQNPSSTQMIEVAPIENEEDGNISQHQV